MKKLFILSIFLLALTAFQQAKAQTVSPVIAVGTASSVKVTQVQPPTYSTPLWIGSEWKTGDPCNQVFVFHLGGQCNVGPDDPRYFLDMFNFTTNAWVLNVKPYQSCPEFTGLAHGTYRVRVQRPTDINGAGGCEGGHVRAYNLANQFIGWRGSYTNSPFVASNSVVVGASVQSDINWTFFDIQTPTNYCFNYNQPVIMNTTGTINYDRWWLAIFENGGQNRYWSQGWTFGQIPGNQLNLSNLVNGAFGSNPNGFEQFPVNYTVQFAIATPYNMTWIELSKQFSVAPINIFCRSVDDEPIAITPNPASTTFHIANLDLNSVNNYRLTLTDLSGRTVQSLDQIAQEDIDISDLDNGLYIVNIWEGNKRIHSSKLSVIN